MKKTILTLTITALLVTALAISAHAYSASWTKAQCNDYSWTGIHERYVYGGSNWIDNDTWDSNEGCDCSAYVNKCWAIPDYTATSTVAGHPYNTTTYYYYNCPYAVSKDRNNPQYLMTWVYQSEAGGPGNHMGLFHTNNGDGTWWMREAKGSSYGIVVNSRSLSTLISWNYRCFDRKDWGATVADIIIDNSSSAFTASSNWATATSSTDKYGTNYRWRSTAATSDPAQWSPNITVSGSWTVYAWWTAGGNRSSNSAYQIHTSSGDTNVYVNQQTNGGKWNSLGSHSLATGNAWVKKSCWATTGYVVIADAIKWHKN